MTHWNADTPSFCQPLSALATTTARVHNDALFVSGSRACPPTHSLGSPLTPLTHSVCPFFRNSSKFSMLCAELLTKFASRQTTAECQKWAVKGRRSWGGVTRLSFKAARAAVSWLHKNEITQEIKLAQNKCKKFGNKNWRRRHCCDT